MYVLVRDSGAFAGITPYKGERGAITGFDLHWFGAALTVGIALITQIGKQADYLRFMPLQTTANRRRWWAGVLSGEPGWVLLGCAQNAGRRFSSLPGDPAHGAAGKSGRPQADVFGSARTYLPNYGWAVAATELFVVTSQLKSNVTNAYAGWLAGWLRDPAPCAGGGSFRCSAGDRTRQRLQ